MNPKITFLKTEPNYCLLFQFDNGEQGFFDMKPYLNYPIYKKLLNPILFNQATLQHGIVVWNDSIDLDPDIAYLESTKHLLDV